MVVKDIWGSYVIEQKYERIINADEFQNLKNKLQLGLNTNCNANHTRYQHCLGTYYLACKLVTICKEKFSNILTISLEDEEAIKCAALLHDLGHGFFSHVSENFLKGTHEERTVYMLLDKNSQIHNIIIETFGKNVLEKILDLIKMKEKIKNKEYQKDNTDLMLIIRKLLSGGIDIDRLDYINRDSINVYGEKNDYSSILEYITLENIDDSLEVVFSEEAEYLISNFLIKKFSF